MNANSGGSFATLTHARLRAAQGDVPGAVRILRVILEVQPEHHEARRFLAEIENRRAVAHAEPGEGATEPVTPATVDDLTRRFRDALDVRPRKLGIRRLEFWLARVQSHRGARRVR